MQPKKHYLSGTFRGFRTFRGIVAVGSLPGQQDAIDRFWNERVESQKGCDLTTEELFGAYAQFCVRHGLPAYPEGEFQGLLPDQIRERFGVNKLHSILRDQKARRRFANIRLRAEPPGTGSAP
jgi:hypothetical protein